MILGCSSVKKMRDLYYVQAVEDLTECKTFAVFCRLGILSNIWNKSRDCTHN